MPDFDHAFLEETMTRIANIPAEKKPVWGSMNRDQMIGHLTAVFHYTLGLGPEMPDMSTWFSRNVLRHLLLSGVVRIPKNVRAPRPTGAPSGPPPEGDATILLSTMEEYLARAQAGDLDPPPHPFFCDLGVDGWARFHCRHVDHHLRQFGV